jgi:hypothetical protein
LCAADPEWCYIGSTFLTLRDRFTGHKSDFWKWQRGEKVSSCACFPHFAEFGLESHSIELLQEYQVIRTHSRDHKHLDLFETIWIDLLKGCCNQVRPFQPFRVISKANADRLGITQNPALLSAERRRNNACQIKNRKDPKKRAAMNKRENEWQRERRATDPEYAEKHRAKCRAWRARKKAEDPEWAEKERARNRAYQARKKAEDPEWAEKVRARNRAYQARKKAENPELFAEKQRAATRAWRAQKKAEAEAAKEKSN